MVFGRRAEKVCVRPAAPGVDQILADLEAAGTQDPVFALSTGKTNTLQSSFFLIFFCYNLRSFRERLM